MNVPFLDLRISDATERKGLLDTLEAVLLHGRIVLGPEVETLEKRVAKVCGRAFAVGVNSGTDALMLAFKSLNLSPGDEVITPPLSFIATANAIRLNGLVPVFADIDDDLNLDPSSIEALITTRSKAIVVVHWAGKLCRMDAILAIAERHGLIVVEDASQAFSAQMGERKAGNFGHVACFSMNSMKPFASLGEAGMVVTDDAELNQRLIALRYHGLINREECHYISHNGRLDTLQAAVLLYRMDGLESLIAKRRKTAHFYHAHLGDVVTIPVEQSGFRDVYYTYTIRNERRDELQQFLAKREIETKIQHPLLMPQHPAYRGSVGHYPNAERLVRQVLCLPIHEKLTSEQSQWVVTSVRAFIKSCV